MEGINHYKMNRSWRKLIMGFIVPALLLTVWVIISRSGMVSDKLLPAPLQVISTLFDLLKNQGLLTDIIKTVSRVLHGYLIGSIAGFIIGALMGSSRTCERLIAPVFHVYRQVPAVGWIPVILLWLGTSDMVKVIFIALGAFTPMALNTFAGIRNVPEQLVEVARVFGFSGIKTFYRVIFPSALPSIVTGAKVSLNLAWMFVIAAEIMTYSTGGLGFLLDGARDMFRMDILLAGILVIFIIGLIMNYTVEKIQTIFLWRN
jgi:sulfonate transport system permease protein